MLTVHLNKEGVSFDIREKAVYLTPTLTPAPATCSDLDWWSSSNRIKAWPTTCTVDYNQNPHATGCSPLILWCAENNYSKVTVKLSSGQQVGSGNRGSVSQFIPVGGSKIFILYSGSTALGNVSANTTTVGTPASATGTLTISPSQCVPKSGSTSCTVYVSWSITGSSNPKITFKWPNSSTQVWSYAPAGNNNPVQLRTDLPNRDLVQFSIYDGANWIMDAVAEIP